MKHGFNGWQPALSQCEILGRQGTNRPAIPQVDQLVNDRPANKTTDQRAGEWAARTGALSPTVTTIHHENAEITRLSNAERHDATSLTLR